MSRLLVLLALALIGCAGPARPAATPPPAPIAGDWNEGKYETLGTLEAIGLELVP